MSRNPILRASLHSQPDTSAAHVQALPIGERPNADAEMTRVLKMPPIRMASEPASGVIAHWKHDALHDVVAPMVDHVLMTSPRDHCDLSGGPGTRWCVEQRVLAP